MFSRYKSPFKVDKQHPIRDGLGRMFTGIVSISYQIIPVLIVLRVCKVINIHLDILIMAWIGYQFIEFVTDLIDNAVSNYDERKRAESYKACREKAVLHEIQSYEGSILDDSDEEV